MNDRHKIEMTTNGNSGSAEIAWIPESKFSAAHYAAFIDVPYKDAKWENLFIYDKNKSEEAIEKGKEYLKINLESCTMF